MNNKKDTYKFFSIRFNSEEWNVMQKLKKNHGINLSASIKLFFKKKLEELEEFEASKN